MRELPDSRLDLLDVFVVDGKTEKAARPNVTAGELPAEPAMYQDAEWASYFQGNVLEDKEPMKWVYKVYLLGIKSVDPFTLDLETIFVLDSSDGSVSRCQVKRLAPLDTPEELLTVRIRENGVTIDTEESVPCAEEVARSKIEGVPALSILEKSAASEGVEESSAAVAEESGIEKDVMAADEDDDDAKDYDEDDDDTLNDFLVEIDDDSDSEFDEFDDDGDGEEGGY